MFRWLQSHHQSVTSFAAIMVSLIALYVAWDQSRVMRAQQHGAVIPALQVDGFVTNQGERLYLGLRVFNNGVGPAFIETVQIYRDGELQSDLSGLLDAVDLETNDRSWTSMVGRVMAPGQSVEPARMGWPQENVRVEHIAALTREFSRWDTQICYCSVFERCWIASSSNARTRDVERCEPAETDVFESFGILGVEAAQEVEE